jgi:hypothetical protein
MRFVIFAACLTLAAGTAISAKPRPPGIDYYDTLLAADAAYKAQDFTNAAKRFSRLSEAGSEDWKVWWRLGYSRYETGDFQGAAQALEHAAQLGSWFEERNAALVAKSYARAGMPEQAITWLKRALFDERYEDRGELLKDEAFTTIRNDPGFRTLLAPQPPAERNAAWAVDLDYLISEVRRLNARYSHEPFPSEFNTAVAGLRADIPRLDDAQIAVRMQGLMAILAQSHNGLWLGSGEGRVRFGRLPVAFYAFPEGLFIIDALDSHKELIGSQVLGFDRTPAAEALKAVGSFMNRENDMETLWLGPTYLGSPQVLYGLGLTGHKDAVRLKVQPRIGPVRNVFLQSTEFPRSRKLLASRLANAPPAPLYLQRVEDYYWFVDLPGRPAVYVQFNQVFEKEDETLEQFAIRLQEHLATHPEIRNLIIDLRHNNGGNTYDYPRLITTLAAFEARPATKLYALIGRNTFSAAGNFIVDLERFSDVIFVGEPSGAKPNSYGDESPTTLPFSRIQGGFSSVYWQLSSPRDERSWIAPQVPVQLTAKDYFMNRDPAMETVLALIDRDVRNARARTEKSSFSTPSVSRYVRFGSKADPRR